MAAWYEDPEVPVGTYWWAVEHLGHPAFYLRALLPGDFKTGRGPLARHTYGLDGRQLEDVRCETCHEKPRPDDLDPIERKTHTRGFLDVFRAGRAAWPHPTTPSACWLCSNPRASADHKVSGRDVCACCAAHMVAVDSKLKKPKKPTDVVADPKHPKRS